jgi:hypothetical protein
MEPAQRIAVHLAGAGWAVLEVGELFPGQLARRQTGAPP